VEVQRPRGRRNDVIGRVRGIDREHLAMMGNRELTPQEVLEDLLGSEDFPVVIVDTRAAARIILRRLEDAGFEIVEARRG
jgi:hypothetical protein